MKLVGCAECTQINTDDSFIFKKYPLSPHVIMHDEISTCLKWDYFLLECKITPR